MLLAALMAFFVAVVGGTLGGTHSMDKRKTIVGILCVIVSLTMYTSPLTVMVSSHPFGTPLQTVLFCIYIHIWTNHVVDPNNTLGEFWIRQSRIGIAMMNLMGL